MQNVVFGMDQLIRTNGNLDLTPPEIKTIATFVMHNEQVNPNSKYLEVGVFGGGTIKFIKSLTKTTQFFGVDLFEDYAPSNQNTHHPGTYKCIDVQNFLGDRVTLIKGDSLSVLPKLTDKFNFIFIDGNHKYDATLKDFNNAKNLLADGGQIAFHNASSHMTPDFELYNNVDGGPWRVVQELIMSDDWKLVSQADRLAVFKKINK